MPCTVTVLRSVTTDHPIGHGSKFRKFDFCFLLFFFSFVSGCLIRNHFQIGRRKLILVGKIFIHPIGKCSFSCQKEFSPTTRNFVHKFVNEISQCHSITRNVINGLVNLSCQILAHPDGYIDLHRLHPDSYIGYIEKHGACGG